MFSYKLCNLVAINVNARYLFVELLNIDNNNITESDENTEYFY